MKQARGARLGQHFLKNFAYAAKLAHSAGIKDGDTVLEIGPGKGILTEALLKTGARVVAIEKDEALVQILSEKFTEEVSQGRLEIVTGDVRNVVVAQKAGKTMLDARRGESDARVVLNGTMSATQRLRNNADSIVLPADYVLAANIPYYITGEIIRKFLTAEHQPRRVALLVQKEVAERIVSNKESILSLSVKAYGTPKIIARVNRKHFSPPPAVDSAILVIENISRDFFAGVSEERFFAVVRAGFSSKRKFLSNNLGIKYQVSGVRKAFELCGVSETARAEDVGLAQWKCLTSNLIPKT